MLTAFRDCCGLMYAEVGLDARKEKQDVTQDSYFNTLMCLRNVIQFKRRWLLSQKVILIHDNAHLHRAQLIQLCWKIFIGNSSNILHTHQTWYLETFISPPPPPLKNCLEGNIFKREELILAVANIWTALGRDYYHKVIEKLVHRYRKCLDRHSDFVKK